MTAQELIDIIRGTAIAGSGDRDIDLYTVNVRISYLSDPLEDVEWVEPVFDRAKWEQETQTVDLYYGT